MTASIRSDSGSVVLHFAPVMDKLNEQDFLELCRVNRDLRLELTAEGDLIILPPAGGETGNQNFTLAGIFSSWVDADQTGLGFDSSTGFKLPNGALRSPDLAWVRRDRWSQLTPKEKERLHTSLPGFPD